jgi:hypothetical protein
MIEEHPEKVIAMVREGNRDADGQAILNNCNASVGRASSAKERAQNGLGPTLGPPPTGTAGLSSSGSSMAAVNCEL